MKGSMIVGACVFPLVDVYLDDGQVWLTALAEGPLDAGRAHGYTIHGRDGRVVLHAEDADIEWPEIHQGGSVMISIALGEDAAVA